MCGIAGYSLGTGSRLDRTLVAQALLRGDRRARRRRRRLRVPHGRRRCRAQAADEGASALIDSIALPDTVGDVPRPRPRLHEGAPDDPREQPPHPARPRGGDPQRDHRERRRALRASRHPAAGTRDDRRLRGDLRPRRRVRDRRPRRSGSSSARWRPPGSTSATRRCSTSPAASDGRSGSVAAGTRCLFASTRAALEVAEHALHTTFLKSQVDEGRLLRLVDGAIVEERGCGTYPTRASGKSARSRPCVRPQEGRSASSCSRRSSHGLTDASSRR